MSKIIKLNLEDTYCLVDVEGWLGNAKCNRDILAAYPEICTGMQLEDVSSGDGYYEGSMLIDESEYSYFEKIELIKQPHLWDGEEPLAVGMVVKCYNESNCIVIMLELELDQVILRMVGDNSLNVTHPINIKRANKSPKEIAKETFMKKWKGQQGLDFAWDTEFSTAPIGVVFDMVYDLLKGN